MKKILILQVGGTIAGNYENDQLVYKRSTRLLGDYLTKAHIGTESLDVEHTGTGLQIAYDTFSSKNSTEITDEDRERLARYVDNTGHDQIIILYGNNPDSYFSTEKYLKPVSKRKTIIFVGSKKPFDVYFSDAPVFLGMALALVQEREYGIYHVINF